MSIKALNHVWEHSQAKGSALVVLLAIADMANDDGDCWPGVCRLAEKCRLTERHLQKVIRSLEEMGELKTFTNDGKETGHGKTNRYQVQTLTESHVQNDGVSSTTPLGVSPMTPKPSVEPTISGDLVKSTKSPVCGPADKPKKQRPRNLVFDMVAHLAYGVPMDVGATLGNTTAVRVGMILSELKSSRAGVLPTADTIREAVLWWRKANPTLTTPRDPAKFDAMIREYEQHADPRVISTGDPAPSLSQAEKDRIRYEMFGGVPS